MKQFWRNLMSGELSAGAAFLLVAILIFGTVAVLAVGEEAVEELTGISEPADSSAASPNLLPSVQLRLADISSTPAAPRLG
ncbi:MAG TPA: hypothetical protein VKV28_01895 [Candidatus Binataceae bacterium]|nr:hypothetical protein [Candidatus Binataceae bacterium]